MEPDVIVEIKEKLDAARAENREVRAIYLGVRAFAALQRLVHERARVEDKTMRGLAQITLDGVGVGFRASLEPWEVMAEL